MNQPLICPMDEFGTLIVFSLSYTACLKCGYFLKKNL